MDKQSLLSKQIIIILFLLGAAIAGIETANQYMRHGFSGWRLYFFAAIFITCISMYFVKKKQRFEKK
jgi:hypothetical protein